jgi:hypothetical protein
MSNQESKGAFKYLPPELQPVRIPVAKIPLLEKKLVEEFSYLGDLHFPNTLKKCKKETTGDLDVLFVPKIGCWREKILLSDYACETSGNKAQMMVVMNNLLGDDQRYMIDFLVVKEGGLEFKKLFYGYGTTFSALLGSFARSIGYKFTDYALYKRVKRKNGWCNIQLTTEPKTALYILGLDPAFINNDAIFTPEGVATWISNSPRFDSNMWKYGNPDKIAVGIPINKNAREAIKKNEDTSDAYELLNLVEKVGGLVSLLYYEERFLTKQAVRRIIKKIEEVTTNTEIILNGNEIMDFLGVKPSPLIGKYQKLLAEYFKDIPADERRTLIVKDSARKLLQSIHCASIILHNE